MKEISIEINEETTSASFIHNKDVDMVFNVETGETIKQTLLAYNKNGKLYVGNEAGEKQDDVFIHNPYQRYFFPDYEPIFKANGEEIETSQLIVDIVNSYKTQLKS